MIEYNLMDSDENIFELNGTAVSVVERKSLTFASDRFEVESRTEDNSYLPGKIKIGENRLKSKEIPYSFEISQSADSDYNTLINTILYNLNKCEYLIDDTNSKRIKVTFLNGSVSYDAGSHKRSGTFNFSLLCLEPYWEDLTEQTVSGTTTADTWEDITVNNNGFLELFPTIEVYAAAACSYVEARVDVQSIRIEDNLFGSTNYETMKINNGEGFVAVGIIDKTTSIISGLGFINIPVGSNTLRLITDIACNYTIKYRRRYYV